MAQAAQMGQGSALGFLGVTEQATGCANGQGQVFAAKALEVLGRELLAQAFERRVALKVPRRTATNATTFFRRQALRPVIRDHQLDRVDALKLGQQVFPALDLQHREIAAGDIQHGEAKQALIAQYGGNQVVAALIHQRLVTHGARGDDTNYLTLNRAFAGGRVADLLADHHRLAQLDQLGQVAFGRMIRDPAHRNRLAGRLAACREGDIQQLGSFLRVFVEDLVEIAHAIEHQLVRVLVLQAPVLLHHRRMAGQVGGIFTHQGLGGFVQKWGKGRRVA